MEEAAGDFPWWEEVGEVGHPEFPVWMEVVEGGLRLGPWMEEGEEGLLGLLWKVEVGVEPSCGVGVEPSCGGGVEEAEGRLEKVVEGVPVFSARS